MAMLLKSLIAAGFPALAFLSSVFGHRAGMPAIWRVVLSLSFIALGVALSGKLGKRKSAHLTVINKRPSDYARKTRPCHWNPRQ